MTEAVRLESEGRAPTKWEIARWIITGLATTSLWIIGAWISETRSDVKEMQRTVAERNEVITRAVTNIENVNRDLWELRQGLKETNEKLDAVKERVVSGEKTRRALAREFELRVP